MGQKTLEKGRTPPSSDAAQQNRSGFTVSLLALGTILVFGLEYNHTLKDLSFWEKLNISFFQSVTARTAGYATIPQGELGDATKLVTIILMFIGASPSSTGGGICFSGYRNGGGLSSLLKITDKA